MAERRCGHSRAGAMSIDEVLELALEPAEKGTDVAAMS